MGATKDNGWISARKPTTKPTGPVRDGFIVVTAPDYRTQHMSHQSPEQEAIPKIPAHQRHAEARKVDLMYRWRVFNEQARKRKIAVSISFDEYSRIVRTACSYCGEFTHEGYSGVDRVQNAGSYRIDNVVACCKTCNFMEGPLSVKEFLGKVEHIAKRQQALYRSSEHGENTSEAVVAQRQLHHAARVVDVDPVPVRGWCISIPVCVARPISPVGRVEQSNQCVTVGRRHRRSWPVEGDYGLRKFAGCSRK